MNQSYRRLLHCWRRIKNFHGCLFRGILKRDAGMRIKRVLGKVLDKRGLEVGKVNDAEFDPESFAILRMEAKLGLRRKYKIKPGWIASIGSIYSLTSKKARSSRGDEFSAAQPKRAT